MASTRQDIIYYCHSSSPSTEFDTNLQLYSLRKAADEWNNLVKLIDVLDRGHQLERFTFILNCLGLSLLQLMGQNSPSPDKNKIGGPEKLLNTLLAKKDIDRNTRHYLKNEFKDFLKCYNSLRHFGLNKEEKNYRTIDLLTMEKIDQFCLMTIKIWDIVIKKFKEKDRNRIEISSVAEVVRFADYNRLLKLSEHRKST